jgi:hypothetical protein
VAGRGVAFILSFGEDGPDTQVISDGSRFFIRMMIGFDPEAEISYFLTTALDFSVSISGYELSFWIAGEGLNGLEEPLWDGTETWFIGQPNRGLILLAILLSVRVLVPKVKPERVFMIALRDNLPDRAIQKYLEINRVFEERGYSVTECDPRYGNRCWLMELPGIV